MFLFQRKNWYRVTTSQAGKVVLITGANSGIGKVAAIELARNGAQVILACRSVERTQPVLDEIAKVAPAGTPPAQCWQVDLMSLESVNALADRFIASGLPLHVLINNAGFAGRTAVTSDGFEPMFQVNYLSHFVLTLRLLPVLKTTAAANGGQGARIVNVSSTGHFNSGGLQWDKWVGKDLVLDTSTPGVFARYCDSKWCQVVFTRELAERLKGTGVSVYALHPGGVWTNVWREMNSFLKWVLELILISEFDGATTTLLCATSPDVESGAYYDQCNKTAPKAGVDDKKNRDELWARSLELGKVAVDTSVPAATTTNQ